MQIQDHERNAELYAAYKKALLRKDVHNVRDAVEIARNMPCSQFYVSNEDAWRYVCMRESNVSDIGTSPRNEIFEMIYERYLHLKEQREFENSSPRFIFSFAYTSQAPCFFLSFRRAYDIIRQMRKHGHVKPRKIY